MQHSTGKPTADEAERMTSSKLGPCMACVARLAQGELAARHVVVGCEYNHCKSGNRRRGHRFGYALCIWHHRGHPLRDWTAAWTRKVYGPSLMDGSALFHRVYGTDDELIELQDEWLEREHVVVLED